MSGTIIILKLRIRPSPYRSNKKGAPKNSERLLEIRILLRAEDCVLGGLRDLELHDALGRNLNLLASRRITAETGSAVLQLQLAEAGQRESVLRIFVSQISERLEI